MSKPAEVTAQRPARRKRFAGSYKLPDEDYKQSTTDEDDDYNAELAKERSLSSAPKKRKAQSVVEISDDDTDLGRPAKRVKVVARSKPCGKASFRMAAKSQSAKAMPEGEMTKAKAPSAPASSTARKVTKGITTPATTPKAPIKLQQSKPDEPKQKPAEEDRSQQVSITIPVLTAGSQYHLEQQLAKLVNHYAFANLHGHDSMAEVVLNRITSCRFIDFEAFMFLIETFYDHAAKNVSMAASDLHNLIEEGFWGYRDELFAADMEQDIVRQNGPMKDMLYRMVGARFSCDPNTLPREVQDAVFAPLIASYKEELQKKASNEAR